MRPLAGLCICTNTSSAAYQPMAKTIIMRAGRIERPARLTAIEPSSEPNAKLATSVPSPVCPMW